jgi:arylsulfatase A-like enzyme
LLDPHLNPRRAIVLSNVLYHFNCALVLWCSAHILIRAGETLLPLRIRKRVTIALCCFVLYGGLLVGLFHLNASINLGKIEIFGVFLSWGGGWVLYRLHFLVVDRFGTWPIVSKGWVAYLGATVVVGVNALAYTLPIAGLGSSPEGDVVPISAEPAPAPSNFLLITVDTLRADHLGCYGYERDTSSHIDSLAREGIRFEEAFSPTSWTLPAVASLMTSMYPSVHGCIEVNRRLAESVVTLAEVLKGQGFGTAGFVSHTLVSQKYGFAQGFDVFDDTLASSVNPHLELSSHQLTEKAIDWIAGRSQGRFFAWVHYFDPHFDYRPPPSHDEFGSFDVDRYDGEVRFTDEQIGRLLAKVEELGLSEETLVIFTADHGEEFRDHGGIHHTRTLFDEIVRVPLIIKIPGYSAGVIGRPVQLMDVMPTALEALNLPVPPDLGARSVVPLIRGENMGERSIFGETSRDASLRSVRSGPWKLIWNMSRKTLRLYNTALDRKERANMVLLKPALARELKARLNEWMIWGDSQRRWRAACEPVELDEDTFVRLKMLGYIR